MVWWFLSLLGFLGLLHLTQETLQCFFASNHLHQLKLVLDPRRWQLLCCGFWRMLSQLPLTGGVPTMKFMRWPIRWITELVFQKFKPQPASGPVAWSSTELSHPIRITETAEDPHRSQFDKTCYFSLIEHNPGSRIVGLPTHHREVIVGCKAKVNIVGHVLLIFVVDDWKCFDVLDLCFIESHLVIREAS